MFDLTVDVFEKWHQFFFEDFVVVWAAEPAGRTKVFESDATLRTFGAIERFEIVGDTLDFDRLGFGQSLSAAHVRFVEVLLGTFFTEVKLFNLLGADNFGQVQGRRLRTALASHASFPRVLRFNSNVFGGWEQCGCSKISAEC